MALGEKVVLDLTKFKNGWTERNDGFTIFCENKQEVYEAVTCVSKLWSKYEIDAKIFSLPLIEFKENIKGYLVGCYLYEDHFSHIIPWNNETWECDYYFKDIIFPFSLEINGADLLSLLEV